jgi:hypothetical protein
MTIQPVLVPASDSLDLMFGHRGEGAGREVEVWWGLSLVERLQFRSSPLEYKLSAARYCNMEVPSGVLVQEYGFARSTLRRYGRALRSGDAKEVGRVFSGRGGPRTITPQIDAYVRGRYLSLRGSVRDYNAKLRGEVEKRWGVKVSAERLRRIFRDEDRIQNWTRHRRWGGRSGKAVGANCCDSPSEMSLDRGSSRNSSTQPGVMPFSGQEIPERGRFLHHAGLVLLYPWLDLILAGWPDNLSLLRQLFTQVLCGAVNHEQTKAMHMPSLKVLCGPTVRSPWYLRRLTDRLATPRNTAEVLRRNLGLLGEPRSEHYLYDPHAHRYTGELSVLKVWIGSDHLVDKGLLLDLVHTPEGRPCILLHHDNFHDVRERFHMIRQVMAELLGVESARGLNWVADRAIFGLDCVGTVVDDGQGIVTWQKGYAHDGWKGCDPFQSVMLTRPRNDSRDLQSVRLDFQADTWESDNRFRRMIVKAYKDGPERPPLDVAVLAGGTVPDDTRAVQWMFSRWPQESNIGYLLRHVGLGELTSRAWDSYEQIADTVQDRQVESLAHKELSKCRQDLELKLGRKLLRQRREKRKGAPDPSRLEQERKEIRSKLDNLAARYDAKKAEGLVIDLAQVTALLEEARQIRADTKKVEAQSKRAQKMTDLSAEIDELTVRLEAVEQDLRNTPRQESRLEQIIAAGHVRLDTRRKAFMDAVRITCCNVFLGCLDVFRTFYDNRRDDHDLLRALTRSPGFLTLRNGTIHITLVPELSVQPKAFAAMRRLCEQVTAVVNRTWRGRASPIVITLAETPPRNALGPMSGGP